MHDHVHFRGPPSRRLSSSSRLPAKLTQRGNDAPRPPAKRTHGPRGRLYGSRDSGCAAVDRRPINQVPNPFPLTLAGMLAALGPQAINFGISIGGGEAYLLPNVAARGTLHMHWLMTVSVILETALVYECIKYSVCTGRSFFAATNELKPFGFWPWFWAVVSIVTFAWPAWMGGAVIAAHRFTGIGEPASRSGRRSYLWAVIALLAVLVVFYFSNRTYAFLSKFFTFIMFANIILVLAITVIAAKPAHYWQVLLGYLGITFLAEGYPAALPEDRRAGALQPARRQPDVGELLGHRGRLRDGSVLGPGHRRAPAAREDHRPGAALGHERRRTSAARWTSGSRSAATASSSGGRSSAA